MMTVTAREGSVNIARGKQLLTAGGSSKKILCRTVLLYLLYQWFDGSIKW